MKKKVIITAVSLATALAAGGLLYFTRNHLFKEVAAAATPPPAAPIVAGTVAQHDVPIYLTGVGTVIAYNTDIVRARSRARSSASTSPRGRPSMPAICSRRSIRVPIRRRSNS